MSDDVSRETLGPHRSPEHEQITGEKPIEIYDPRTKSLHPAVIEYRADGCLTSRKL